MIARLEALYAQFVKVANYLQSPLLLLIRVDWGYQFYEAGSGKLADIPTTIENFTKMGVPLPAFNAHFIGWLETVGGILLILGLASRLIAVPLVINMITAFVIADSEALKSIFSEPDKFFNAAPHTFLIASLVVLIFGPGKLSLDTLIAAWWKKRRPQTSAAT